MTCEEVPCIWEPRASCAADSSNESLNEPCAMNVIEREPIPVASLSVSIQNQGTQCNDQVSVLYEAIAEIRAVIADLQASQSAISSRCETLDYRKFGGSFVPSAFVNGFAQCADQSNCMQSLQQLWVLLVSTVCRSISRE